MSPPPPRRAPELPWTRAVRRLRRFFFVDIWRSEADHLGWPLAPTYRVLRVLQLAVRGIFVNRATFTASALTYTTVLTLVPLLAFAFSVAKGVGVFDRLRTEVIEPFIDTNLGATDAATPESVQTLRGAIDSVLDLVSATDVSSLGLLGLGIVVLAVIRVLSHVEEALNRVWGVRRARSPVRRVADYLSLAVITPLLLIVAVSVTTAAQNSRMVEILRGQPGGEAMVDGFFGFTPLLAVWVGFTLLYLLLPNTRVSVLSSIIGGVVGGTLWQLAQIGHAKFQMGIASYNAIYSSFAALPIFFVWVYVSWVTVMFGGEFAHSHQIVGEHRRVVLSHPSTQRQREVLGLRAVTRITAHFLKGGSSWIMNDLADELGVAAVSLRDILEDLIEAGVLSEGRDGRRATVLLARDPQTTRASDVVEALRGENLENGEDEDSVQRVIASFDEAQRAASGNATLAELASADSGETELS